MDGQNRTNEKKYTIIIYVLIGILVVLIGAIIYLKISNNKKIAETNKENYISIEEIAGSLNVSDLANRYADNDADFVAVVSDNGLIVTYIKDDTVVNLDIPLKDNTLVVTTTDNNSDIITDIYKEIATIICMYYDNAKNNCRYTLDNITTDSDIKGIKFDNNKVYININRSIEASSIEYNTVTKTSINDDNYTLELSNIRLKDIIVSTSHINITVMGNVERLTSDRFNFSILVKLYDRDGNVLGKNTYDFNDSNPLDKDGTFSIMFEFDDILDDESVTDYSIEIVK